jgi:hypothetical protein
VATDRLVKLNKNARNYSVQQLISCGSRKNENDGCSGSTVDLAWSKL